jgi:hypothetical protein
MRMLRSLAVAVLAFGAGFGALPNAAKADWLGLADGTYDVTLTCVLSSVIPCPSQFQGTVTIEGAGATFLSYTVNGELFSGDPTDGVFTNSVADFQYSRLENVPFSFADLRLDLSTPNPQIPDDQWWVYCDNVSSSTCTPAAAGTWSAVAVAEVPEPFTLALFAAGLAGLGFRRRRPAAGSGAGCRR